MRTAESNFRVEFGLPPSRHDIARQRMSKGPISDVVTFTAALVDLRLPITPVIAICLME